MAFDIERAYELMFTIRVVELKLLDLLKSGEVLGTTHACIGQESIPVGVSLAKGFDDVVFSNHRGHGHMLSCGLDIKKFFNELFGKPSGICSGRGGSQHIMDKSINFMGSNGITGGQVPIAVGYSLGIKLSGKSNKVIVYLGDGAFNQGAVAEALNFSSIYSTPIIFVCENNEYGMSSPASKFVSGTIVNRAKSFGIKTFITSGKDVEDVYNVVKEALIEKGPVFIHCNTFRLCGHSRSDLCLYMSKLEIERAKNNDPLFFCKDKVLNLGISESNVSSMELRITNNINNIVNNCLCLND